MMRWGVWDWRGRVCRDKAAQTSSGRMAARRGQRRSDVALARGSTGLELRVGDAANNPADSLNCRRTGSVGSGWPGAMRDAGSVEATRSVAAFPSPLSGLRSNEVRHPGFRLTASPWANIQRRFAACARYGLAARGPGGIPGPPRTEHPACCGRRARHAVPLHGALRDLTTKRTILAGPSCRLRAHADYSGGTARDFHPLPYSLPPDSGPPDWLRRASASRTAPLRSRLGSRAGAPHAYGEALGLRRPSWKVSVADSEGQGEPSRDRKGAVRDGP